MIEPESDCEHGCLQGPKRHLEPKEGKRMRTAPVLGPLSTTMPARVENHDQLFYSEQAVGVNFPDREQSGCPAWPGPGCLTKSRLFAGLCVGQ